MSSTTSCFAPSENLRAPSRVVVVRVFRGVFFLENTPDVRSVFLNPLPTREKSGTRVINTELAGPPPGSNRVRNEAVPGRTEQGDPDTISIKARLVHCSPAAVGPSTNGCEMSLTGSM